MKRDSKTNASSESIIPNAETATGAEDTASIIPEPEQATASDIVARAEMCRARAATLLSERRFAEARKALEEADEIEAGTAGAGSERLHRRMLKAVRRPLVHFPRRSKRGAEAGQTVPLEADQRAEEIVGFHSKLAVVAGLVPGGLLNFAAILAVQATMVWRISNAFGQRKGKHRARGLVLSLLGSAIPTALGGGLRYGVTKLTAAVIGTLTGLVVTPIFAYALTKAVGNTFIMHFESGGTLLTFDAAKFRDYFIKEFQEAGGTVAAA